METKFKLVNDQTTINWIGRKVTGAHNGTISTKEGEFTWQNGSLTGGKVIIDTTSIKILDIKDPEINAQFAGHLASDDFFSSSQYPEASFVITSVEPNNATATIEGNLTIKAITHPITFEADINNSDDTLTLSGAIKIDRTKYGMKFRSGNFFTNLGDTLIYNDFDLNINVTAKN